jgi:arginine-tRNA-protein transferase
MTSLANLKVFATFPHQCSYLLSEEATTLFIDPDTEVDCELYSRLSEMGFRRSGQHLYKPHCNECEACISSRIPVACFRPSRAQKRILKLNADLVARELDDIRDDECYQLYESYINVRHADGDMFPASREQYDSFLTGEWGLTRYYGFYSEEKLVAVTVLDQLENGLSAIYNFFDPAEAKRSLGNYVILWQIQQARDMGLHSVYLGYWIRNCRKMEYKINFRPIELYINSNWVLMT